MNDDRSKAAAGARQWLRRGQMLWRAGRYRAALTQFERAWELEKSDSAALALIRSQLALGRIDAGLQRAERHLLEHPGAAEILLFRALGEFDDGCWDAARATLQQALDCGGGSLVALAHYYLGALRGAALAPPRGDVELNAALEGFEQARAHYPAARMCAFPVQVLLHGLAAAPAQGTIVECGVFWGRSIRLLAERSGRSVHGFDSFRGLPEDWKEGERQGAYSTGGHLPEVPPGVTLHAGWFADTLPPFVAAHPEPIALLHIDCDLYSSTRTALETLAPLLRPGSVLVFDDYWGFPGWQEHEYRAFREFGQERALAFRYLAISLMGREVALVLE